MAQVKRLTGTVKWFNGRRGFGFITPDDGGEDLFVHQTAILSDGFRALKEGELVEFVIDHGGDGRAKALDVTGPEGSTVSSAGGARGRGSGGYDGRGYYGGRGRGYGRGGRMGGGDYDGDYGGGERGYSSGAGCYNCGRPGHLARDCYQGGGRGGRGRYGGGRGGYSGGGGGCYNCGEPGHFARDCPNAKQ